MNHPKRKFTGDHDALYNFLKKLQSLKQLESAEKTLYKWPKKRGRKKLSGEERPFTPFLIVDIQTGKILLKRNPRAKGAIRLK